MDGTELVNIKGQLESVVYENEENSYVVAKAKVSGYRNLVTIVGNIPSPIPGEILSMTGEWVYHPKFGEQFKVVFCSCFVPASVNGIEKYLCSGLIKGIGPEIAKRIVARFGEKTFDIIDYSIERLLEIEGIGKYRIDIIAKAWSEQKEIRSVMIFLQSHGISSTYASKIYKKYGNDSISVVKENPYKLAYDIQGIGFVKADKIAQSLGFDLQSPLRAEAGIIFSLRELVNDGHIYYPYGGLIARSMELLYDEENALNEDILNAAMSSLAADNKIVIEDLENDDGYIIQGVFLKAYHTAEVQIAHMLIDLRNSMKNIRKINVNSALKSLQRQLSINLAEKQIEAIKSSVINKLMVITGGPGTGKTTIIKSILQIFSKVTDKVLLAAPTGRAAKRMSDTTGIEAKTIHRLLEFNASRGGFQRDEDFPLECDLIIIDECSMIDTLLIYHLLKAVPKNATMILVGDVNQLPSVGAGNTLRDIIKAKICSVIELNEIFRQAQESEIIVNSHMIINGNYPTISNGRDSDFFFDQEDDQDKVLEKIIQLTVERIPKKFNYDPMNIQVLTPMNRGIVGTEQMNDSLQDALNPNGFEIARGGRRYRVGDKVMQIKNNYDKNIFNGDIGFICNIDVDAQTVCVNMDGNNVNYEYSELDELVLAYAISIHKSQGSEYTAVVIPLIMSHYIMLQRNLVYTAITRGKKLVVIVGSKRAMSVAIANNKITHRNTLLCKRLQILASACDCS